VFVPFAAALIVDSVSPLHFLRDPRQAAKMARLAGPTVLGHFRHPGRLIGPAVSILRSGRSAAGLDRLRAAGVPVFVIQGTLDLVVPMATARDTVRRAGGQLVTVHRGGHSWLLKDPETLPAIVGQLLGRELGHARDELLRANGVDPSALTVAEVEAVCYVDGARALALAPAPTADGAAGDGVAGDGAIVRGSVLGGSVAEGAVEFSARRSGPAAPRRSGYAFSIRFG
jgi:hypothetical protein